MTLHRPVNQARMRATLMESGWVMVLLLGAGMVPRPASAGPSGRWLEAESARSSLAELNQDLVGLGQAELSGHADEMWAQDPRLVLRAMILRAGREVPATASASRRSERLLERENALEWLRQRLVGDPGATRLWRREVQERLADPSQPVLWCCTARALGRLGWSDQAPAIASLLDAQDQQVVLAARMALFDLFLRWFSSAAEFDVFWPQAQQECSESVFRATALEKESEARALQIQLLQHEPARATLLLQSPDPRLRAAAIGALGRKQTEGAAPASATLLTQLAIEEDGPAFRAAVEALLQIHSGGPSSDPELQRMRALLVQRQRQGHTNLQAPVADALRRMPWTPAGSGADSLIAGVEILVSQLQMLAVPNRLTDRDVLVTCMSALRSLTTKAVEAKLPVNPSLRPVAPMMLGLIEEVRETDSVRIAAAGFLPLVRGAVSIERAVIVLGREDSSKELRYNLLAAIGDMASALDVTEPAAQLVLDTLLAQLQGDDVNLRRRSLKYLSSDHLAGLVVRAAPGAFVRSLSIETVPSLQVQLLDLLAARGGQPELERLMALPNFDEIATSGPAGVASLSQALVRLSKGDATRLVQGMARLLDVQNAETRVLRLRGVLGAIASLPAASIVGLDAGSHHQIVTWAMELRGAASSVPGGQAFLERLLATHIQGCAASAEQKHAPELAHVRALFLSDLIALDPASAQPAEVLEQFGLALQLCTDSGDSARRQLVLRDRARYESDRGDEIAALKDYRELFLIELPLLTGDPSAVSSVLDQRDLRRAGALLAQRPSLLSMPEAEAQLEALLISEILVRQPSWRLEPEALRIQDLRELAGRALLESNLTHLEGAILIFSGLPAIPATPEEGAEPTPLPAAPEGVLWAGLLGNFADHQELLGLFAKLQASAAVLQVHPGAPAEAKGEPAEAGQKLNSKPVDGAGSEEPEEDDPQDGDSVEESVSRG
ncbi:MAG: hypothetical protein ACI9F9_001717 [Candidatus Paceibacteria bacterium]|jgi:hypothetical protein